MGASGGKDGTAMLWDVNDGKHLYSLDASAPIQALCFSPKNYWLCAATDTSIKIWDLENKSVHDEIFPAVKNKTGLPWLVSIPGVRTGTRCTREARMATSTSTIRWLDERERTSQISAHKCRCR